MHHTLVIVPGVDNSGPGHWQTLLEHSVVGAVRVEQEDWSWPVRQDWVAALADTLAGIEGHVLLVAHSAGAVTVAAWAAATKGGDVDRVLGALLVAPPDFETEIEGGLPLDLLEDSGWVPAPRRALPFPSIVVASTNDPYASIERAEGLARDWGSRFVRLEGAGHINADAGFGAWPLAEELVAELLAQA